MDAVIWPRRCHYGFPMVGNISTRSDEITALLMARGPLPVEALARLVDVAPAVWV